MKLYSFVSICCLLAISFSCTKSHKTQEVVQQVRTTPTITKSKISEASIVILGTIQDAGSPQMGCKKECCATVFTSPDPLRQVSSIGLIDTSEKKTYLFDATPDITSQVKLLTQLETTNSKETPDAIFLTHAHIGHYTGLMHLGKEAMDAKNVPVYGMKRMSNFLMNNGPWSLLVSRQNIVIQQMMPDIPINLSKNIQVTPFLVPHREEFSETVGYKIKGPHKTALYIPDIDKWSVWNVNIVDLIKSVDYAFIDATFYDAQEINNRDISEIPHPFVSESMKTFEVLSKKDRSKIHFIHFNHTNPLINSESKASTEVKDSGYNIAKRDAIFTL